MTQRAKLGGFTLAAALAVTRVSSARDATDAAYAPRPIMTDPALPRLPAPVNLPNLSHERFDLRADLSGGRAIVGGAGRTDTNGVLLRLRAEGSLLSRRLYLGVALPVGSGLPPDGGLASGEIGAPSGSRTLLGSVEAHLRTVFSLPSALEIGFGLGVVAPTATFDRDSRTDRSVAAELSSFDPTDTIQMSPGRVALRPWGDLRLLRGPLVFQGRHGIDIMIDGAGLESARLAGRLLAHLGYLVRSDLELSIEASQIYFLASEEKPVDAGTPQAAFEETYRVRDGHRSAMTVGPALRVAFRDLDLGAALVTNVGDPVSPVINRFVALKISVVGHLGHSTKSK